MISVLYIDDERSLLEVGKNFLERSGTLTVFTAESASEALALVKEHHIDAIISDYQMPTMDGIDLLKAVRNTDPDLPFIFFSGKGTKEIVIEAFKHGADLYLQKHGEPKFLFEDLQHTVTEIVTLRNTERALHESEKLFREVFNNANDAIFLHEVNPEGPGKYIQVNDVAIRWLGYTRDEFLTMSPHDIVPEPVFFGVMPETMKRLIENGQATFESVHQRKDGSTYPVEVSTHIFMFNNRQVALSIVRDITERRKAEIALRKSEQRYRSLFEGVPIGIYRTTPLGQILDINPAFVHLLGYPNREMLMTVSVPDLYMNPGERIQWLARIEREGIVRDFEVQFRKYDGTIIWVRDTGEAVRDDSGQVIYYNGNFEDITESKRAEEALQKSEVRFRALVENASDIIRILDHEGRIVFDTAASSRDLGYPPGYTIGRHPFEFIHPDDLVMVKKKLSGVYTKTNTGVSSEFRIRRANGSYTWVESLGKNLIGVPGVDGVVITTRFIDDRKKAEEALVESEMRYRTLVDNALEAILIFDFSGTVLFANHATATLVEVDDPRALTGRNALEFIAPESRDAVLADFASVMDGRDAYLAQYKVITATGREIWAESIGKKIQFGGAPADIVMLRDITERKRAEEALQLKDFAIVSSINAIAIADLSGNLTYVNPAFLSIWGYENRQEVLGRPVLSFWMVPDEAQQVVDAIQVQGTSSGEMVGQRKDGTPIQVQLSANMIRDASGAPVAMMGSFIDITEHKAAEEALRASEQRYRDVVEDQTEFICRFLPDGRLTFINEAYCSYFGLNREECFGRRHSVILPPEDIKKMKDHLAALTVEHPVALITHRIVLQSGEIRWHRWSDRAIFNTLGDVIEYQSVGRDITSQKKIETQLKNYKETLEQRVRDRTSELSETNLKLKKQIEDRKKIQKKLTLSSKEKDLLLREVHHRVKNNLQLIIGLIDMTKTRAHEPIVISTLTDIMAKVQTMGSIHTRLYESKRFDKINMKRQVHDLVEMISGFCDHDHLDITTNINCAEIYLPVDQAIPCALALNEIISNIHKHAFSGRRSGLVEISSSKKDDKLRFIIRDNGIGLPSGFDIEKSNRLGLKLMRTLVEQQLHGNVQITSKAGTEVVIEFPMNQGESDYGTGTGS